MSLTAELRARMSVRQTGSSDFGGPNFSPDIEALLQLTSGTGANQADIFWSDERTLAASATEDLDLAGVLTDAFGTVVAAAEVVAILVIADAGNTNDVVIGNATQPIPLFTPSTATFAVKPGGFFFVAGPAAAGLLTVGAGATDDLKILNGGAGTGVTYQVALLARSS
jgi:hypothetical protein